MKDAMKLNKSHYVIDKEVKLQREACTCKDIVLQAQWGH